MTYQEYAKYIKFAMDEEVERMQEFLACLGLHKQPEEDCSDDKYWTVTPSNFTMPDKVDLEKAFQGRNTALDIQVITSGSEKDKEDLYLELRDLINS